MRHSGTLLIITLLLAMAVSLPLQAAAPRAVAPTPVVDVGNVRRGEEIRHAFAIRNDGDARLEITEVKPACGCTVVSFDSVIEPGATGLVRTVLDTAVFGGPIAKAVTVFTSDPQTPSINLVLKANVREPVVVRPGYARFVTVQGQPLAASVQTVRAHDRPDLRVLGVRSPYPFVEATFQADEDEPGRWQIELRLDPEAPPGPLADYAVVRTDHPEQAEVKIAVSGLVRPVIAVAPRVADFGRRELDQPQRKSLEVKNLGEAAIELTAATSDLAGLEAEIEPIEEGKHYLVRLTLMPGMPKGDFEARLTIRTSSERQPVLEVPLRGTIL